MTSDRVLPAMSCFAVWLEMLPAAVSANDAEFRVLWCNRAMLELTGAEPVPGSDGCLALEFVLARRNALPPEASPIAVAFRERRAVRGIELLVEKPDGRRTPFLAYATPVHDAAGKFSGTINMLVDIAGRRESEANSRALLAQFIHREKNEIQTIQSLLSGAQRETAQPEARQVLVDTSRRVGAIAAAQGAITRTAGATLDALLLLEFLSGNSPARASGRSWISGWRVQPVRSRTVRPCRSRSSSMSWSAIPSPTGGASARASSYASA